MKCTWTAESSRMKGSVQLGLLWLSLLISSLQGEVETDRSMEFPVLFDDPSSSSFSLYQPEMDRVRRQTVSTEKEDTAKTEVFEPSTEKGKIRRGKRPNPGAFTILKSSELKVYRTKRQNKREKKQRKHPGHNSLLGMAGPPQTGRAKRDVDAGGKRPWPGS